MKKYLLSVLNAFFVEKSTFYSVHVVTANGTRPLCEWFRNINPPRVGEYLAVEVEDTVYEPKMDKRFLYYKVILVTHIIYRKRKTARGFYRPEKEATIIVEFVGREKPSGA